MIGGLLLLALNEFIPEPAKYRKATRIASIGTTAAYDVLYMANELRRRKKQEAKLEECRNSKGRGKLSKVRSIDESGEKCTGKSALRLFYSFGRLLLLRLPTSAAEGYRLVFSDDFDTLDLSPDGKEAHTWCEGNSFYVIEASRL